MNGFHWAVVPVVCAIAACGDPDRGNEPLKPGRVSEGPVTTVEELLRTRRDKLCELVFRGTVGGAQARAFYADEAACREDPVWERESRHFSARYEALIRLEAEGRVRVDPEAVERCIEAAGESNTLQLSRHVACVGMIAGVQQLGEDCTLSEECAGDSYCHFDDRTCPGRCARRVGIGGACGTANDTCSGGRFLGATCKPNVTDGKIDAGNGQCVEAKFEYAREGDGCGFDSAAPEALTYRYCPPDMYCDFEALPSAFDVRGTCKALIAIGDVCDADTDVCQSGGVCGPGSGTRICERFEWLAEGEACEPTAGATTKACDLRAGLSCEPTGCRRPRPGSPCDDLRQATCGESLRCYADVCVELQPEGGRCITGSDCQSGSCGPSRTCRAQYCDADPF